METTYKHTSLKLGGTPRWKEKSVFTGIPEKKIEAPPLVEIREVEAPVPAVIEEEEPLVVESAVDACKRYLSEHEVGSIAEVDAIDFLTSQTFMGETLLPFQSLVVKTLYNLWSKYGVTEKEQELLDILRDKYYIDIDIYNTRDIDKLILVLGRRSTKSSLMSFIATYTAYSLICKGNPQKYYNIRERHPIHIVHVAAKGDQAEEVFTLTANNIRKVTFFKKYIDFDKDNSSELRLFTPKDLSLNDVVKLDNIGVARGELKASRLSGSIIVESITTSAATNRGKAIIVLMLSELAHFERAKFEQHMSEGEVISENPQTDYAIIKALVPSVKDFGKDGKVIMESSPREKGGEFYHQYCLAGGMDQEGFFKSTNAPGEVERFERAVYPEPGYQTIQVATWEARENITRLSLEPEFKADPVGAGMEYGARFGNPSGAYISEEMIEGMIDYSRQSIMVNPGALRFFISLDPGGTAKKKRADTYAVSWGHYAGGPEESNIVYFVDGLKGFDSSFKPLGDGRFEQIPVNPNTVVEYVINLIEGLGGRNFITEIVFDQFQSSAPVATLQSLGYPAIETTFTNKYKSEMYGNFLQKADNGQVNVYGVDPYGYVDQLKIQLKFLQRITSGNVTYYHHPSTGPVTSDDWPDACSNLVHRMCLRATPTLESIEDHRKNNIHTGPIQVKHTGVVMTRAGSAWGGSKPASRAFTGNRLRTSGRI
jgi:hypothetical protein